MMNKTLCIPAIRVVFLSILLINLATGCGGSSKYAYASSDTTEGEAFLKEASEKWSEVKLMTTADYWKEKGEAFDSATVQKHIQDIQAAISEQFHALLKNKKLSKSQADRYLEILKHASSQ